MMAAVAVNMHILCLVVPQLPKGDSLLFGSLKFFSRSRQSSVCPLYIERKQVSNFRRGRKESG